MPFDHNIRVLQQPQRTPGESDLSNDPFTTISRPPAPDITVQLQASLICKNGVYSEFDAHQTNHRHGNRGSFSTSDAHTEFCPFVVRRRHDELDYTPMGDRRPRHARPAWGHPDTSFGRLGGPGRGAWSLVGVWRFALGTRAADHVVRLNEDAESSPLPHGFHVSGAAAIK